METPEGKVSLLDAVPVRCDHILTEWEVSFSFDLRLINGLGGSDFLYPGDTFRKEG